MQVGLKSALLIVEVHYSAVYNRVAYAQIEEIGFARAAGLRLGKVGNAILAGEDLNHGMIDANALQIPFPVQDGDHSHAGRDAIRLEQRRVKQGGGPGYLQAVQVQAQGGKVNGEVLNRTGAPIASLALLSARVSR